MNHNNESMLHHNLHFENKLNDSSICIKENKNTINHDKSMYNSLSQTRYYLGNDNTILNDYNYSNKNSSNNRENRKIFDNAKNMKASYSNNLISDKNIKDKLLKKSSREASSNLGYKFKLLQPVSRSSFINYDMFQSKRILDNNQNNNIIKKVSKTKANDNSGIIRKQIRANSMMNVISNNSTKVSNNYNSKNNMNNHKNGDFSNTVNSNSGKTLTKQLINSNSNGNSRKSSRSKTITKKTENFKHISSSQINAQRHTQINNKVSKDFDNFNNDINVRNLDTPENHYYKIKNLFDRNSVNKYRSSMYSESLLAYDEEYLKKQTENPMIKQLFKYCLSDFLFIEHITTADDSTLVKYCDLIAKLIVDYKTCMNLITRVKKFLRLSVKVVTSLVFEEAIQTILNNCCEILDCERGSIFVYDSVSDMLVVHTGAGIKKTEIRVEKDKGIVGYCFTNNKKLNIEDPYKDERFNKNIDKINKYITRNILCCPLRRNDNTIIGAIQVINKKSSSHNTNHKKNFNKDDEELIEIFSFQLSSFLQNAISYDEKLAFVSRLKQLNDFKVNIDTFNQAETIFDLSILVSNLLMGLWNVYHHQMIIVSNNNKDLLSIGKRSVKKVNKKNGIVGFCIKERKLVMFDSINESIYYNNLIDIEAFQPTITFPIYDSHAKKESITLNSKLIGVIQTAFPYKKIGRTIDVNDNDQYIIDQISYLVSKHIIDKYDLLIKNINSDTIAMNSEEKYHY